MDFEFNLKNVILIGILLIIMVVGIIFTESKNPKEKEEDSSKIVLVNDYNAFFSISGAGNKYISILQNKDTKNLMALLNPSYINENDITEANVLDKLKLLDNSNYTFEAKKMYQEKINNQTRYYLYGHLTKDILGGSNIPEDYYLIIDLDDENSLFAITPYDGKLFKENLNE